MRHKKRFLTMACITALCCAGILTGCGESEDLSAAGISGTALTGSEEDAEDTEDMEDTSSVEHGDVIGKVSYAGSDADNESLVDAKVAEVTSVNEDGTWSLAIYELSSVIAEYEITELTDVAFDNYIDSGVTEDYVMSDADEIQICSNGLLTAADKTAVTEGDMLIFCGNESGGNTITVYHQTDLEAAEDTLETENGEETGAE